MPTTPFNEDAWIKLVFLLADTQQWIDEMSTTVFEQLPVEQKKKLFRSTYRLAPKAMAHILERHYYKIARHPGTGKFTLPVPVILACIRDAGAVEPMPVPGSLNHQRVLQLESAIGFDSDGKECSCLTVLTDPGGTIITAFPGRLHSG